MTKECWGLAIGLLLLTKWAVAGAGQPLPNVELTPVLPELHCQKPVRMEEIPDGSHRFVIAEQEGRILMARQGTDGKDIKEFLNMTNRQPHASYEQGLLGLAFHPQFTSNHLFYIYYCQKNPRRTVLSELRLSATDADCADLSSERVLLELPQPSDIHKAGQVSFGPDGFLYLATGDGGGLSDPSNNAQNTAVLLGKILRLDVNTRSTNSSAADQQKLLPYGIPKDNPFAAEPELPEGSVRKEIWAYGLRNPWRFSWDRETGQMWCGDVGQDQWEEIDLIIKGGNYGWCLREGAHRFKPGPDGAQYIDPVIEYPHQPNLLSQSKFPLHSTGMSVTGGYVYCGEKYPVLRGVYLYADYALGTIWGFRYKDGKVAQYGTLLEQPKNITSFAEDLDGELYVLAYDGHIYSVTAAKPGDAKASAVH